MGANSDPQDQRLLEMAVESRNMKLAWKRVKSNKGSEGVDGRMIEDTGLFRKGPWWNSGLPVLTQAVSPSFFQSLELFNFEDNLRILRKTSN